MRKFFCWVYGLVPGEKFAELKGHYDEASDRLIEMSTAIQRFDFRLQEVSGEWKLKNAALINELKMLRKGVPTACPCPAGHCLKICRDAGQMCWSEWATQKAVQLSAQRDMDRLLTLANHPSRTRIVPANATE